MSYTASDRLTAPGFHGARTALLTAVLFIGLPGGALAQADTATNAPVQSPIVAAGMDVDSENAVLELDLVTGGSSEFALRDGRVIVNGDAVGEYSPDGELDRSWRALLDRVAQAPNSQLAGLLVGWTAPGDGAGAQLDSALENTLPDADAITAAQLDTDTGASIAQLRDQVADYRDSLEEMRAQVHQRQGDRDEGAFSHALGHIGNGFLQILQTLLAYAVLVGIGFTLVFFGNKYLEGVADTARHDTLRSGLVGIAATFLLIPAFIVGILALSISIIGIPLLLLWLPLFPLAVFAAMVFGYLGTSHAVGEALAERRFWGGEWFKRANSYYYVLTGVALLLVLFIGASIAEMGGHWLGFIEGLLTFFGVVLTWLAFSIGLGAVLLSRAGTQPVNPQSPMTESEPEPEPFTEEEPHV